MSAIEEGSAEFAVLPIENSTAGIVSEIYDLLVEFENYIVGEQILKSSIACWVFRDEDFRHSDRIFPSAVADAELALFRRAFLAADFHAE